jgi:SAM-dependent methyltransferase
MEAGVSLNFDRIAEHYDESRGGAARGERIAADLVSWLAPGAVLEVGIGTGVVAVALRPRGVPVHGVDLSTAMLRRAVDRLGPVVVRADALALPVASGSVANVLFVAALHAIGDVPGAVAEAVRVLRPGGRLVAVHNVPWAPADDDVAQALVPLAGLRDFRPDTVAVLDDAAAAESLEPVGTAWTSGRTLAHTPNAMADSIERRLWSTCGTSTNRAGRRSSRRSSLLCGHSPSPTALASTTCRRGWSCSPAAMPPADQSRRPRVAPDDG